MTEFVVGRRYSRDQIQQVAGARGGGNWLTGIVEHRSKFFVFANVGVPGKTGPDYKNRWFEERRRLRWYHKARSHIGWPSVQRLLQSGRTVHVFWRSESGAQFRYAGLARPSRVVEGSSPVEIHWVFDR